MRLDKYLKNARLIKRRPVAKEACDGGRVSVNGRIAKAGTDVGPGDEIAIRFGDRMVQVRVTELIESPRKEQAVEMYEVIDG